MKRILCATHKGLVVLQKRDGKWCFKKDLFLGMPASLVYADPRNGAWWISLAHKHWGHKMHVSMDEGQSWKSVDPPKYPVDTEMKPGVPARLRYVWAFSHGGHARPERMYVGTEPGGLFVTDDYGGSFELVRSLWDHPSREGFWFGGGRDYAGIHTILVHPENDDHIVIGVSCGGVFRSLDGGATWDPINDGLRADYLPNPHLEAGHDPHMMHFCRSRPNVIWQQNHCGVYISRDTGTHWKEVTAENGVGDYGFGLAVDPRDPDRAWIIPAQGDDMRIAYGKSLFVCRTDDGGRSWKELHNGLPQRNFYDIVLRHSLAFDGEDLVFGTTMGHIFTSGDLGESWSRIEGSFPKVNAVVFAS